MDEILCVNRGATPQLWHWAEMVDTVNTDPEQATIMFCDQHCNDQVKLETDGSHSSMIDTN